MSLDGENRFCTNCEHPVGGNFCANCGQSTKNIRISLAGLFSEVLDTYFNLNSKLFLSIKPLLFKPGQLTLAFIEGKRVSFLPPFRMYIVFSLCFFLSLSFLSQKVKMGNNVKMKTDGGNIVLTGIDGDKDNDKAEDKTDSDKTDVSAEQEKPPKDMGLSERFEHHMSKQGDKLSDMNPEQIKAKMLPLLISMTSKALFLLMPFFALMLKLLFVRRDPLYIDHLIFAFHYHSFLFLVLTLLIWWNVVVPHDLGGITAAGVFLIPPLYLYKSMRRVYQQDRLRTVIKFFVLSAAYFMMLLVVVTLATIASVWFI